MSCIQKIHGNVSSKLSANSVLCVLLLQDFKVLYPTLTDYDIRYYIFLLLKALDYRYRHTSLNL
jgi:hypothetical protein